MLTAIMLILLAGDGSAIYGAGVKEETPLITIEAFSENPETYLGKVIKVEGSVAEVCPKAGCWMDLKANEKKVRIKVRDGEIVFDQNLKGKQVLAEGTVYKFELSKEDAVGYFRHLAEEMNQPFDPASVTEGTTIYQIGGIGARVL